MDAGAVMKIYTLLVIIVGGLPAYVRGDETCEVLVQMESGFVCGKKSLAVNGIAFASFMGISYAAAPLGALRFAEPQKPDPFVGVFNGTLPGPACPQNISILGAYDVPVQPDISEDCLRINVNVPLSHLPDPGTECQKPLLPVLVFVHGGNFVQLSGDPNEAGPQYLLSKEIIVVTMNYRLSAFGFLSLGSKEIPGNAGIRDVVFALKWVQRNIRSFGGDQGKVTLGGHSAGSVISHIIALSPTIKELGLFQQLLLLGGTASSFHFSVSPILTRHQSNLFLKAMGIDHKLPPEAIHQELTIAPLKKILDAVSKTKESFLIPFSPALEVPRSDFTTILPEDPAYLLSEGYGKEYPTLIDFVKEECNAFRRKLDQLLPNLNDKSLGLIPVDILLKSNVLKWPILTAMVSAEYFNKSKPTMDKYMTLCTDMAWKYPAMVTTEKRLAVKATSTFVFQFGYESVGLTHFKAAINRNETGHGDELLYFVRANKHMGPSVSDELEQPDFDSRMKKLMTGYISNFVKNGYPGETLSDWPPSGEAFEFMDIDGPVPTYKPATPHMMHMKQFFDQLIIAAKIKK